MTVLSAAFKRGYDGLTEGRGENRNRTCGMSAGMGKGA